MIVLFVELVWWNAVLAFGIPFPIALIVGLLLTSSAFIDPWCDGTIRLAVRQICNTMDQNTTVWSWGTKQVAKTISIVTIPFGDEDDVVLYAKSWLIPWSLVQFSSVLSQEQAEKDIAQIFRRIDQGVTKQGRRVYVRKAVKGEQETHEL